ncbi:MAG: hypothetical protein F6J93_19245 [Oscillatoria sp. SIO1A7]|nr:hypothetical protein [Oscillatoria sp. SIO1A7]
MTPEQGYAARSLLPISGCRLLEAVWQSAAILFSDLLAVSSGAIECYYIFK